MIQTYIDYYINLLTPVSSAILSSKCAIGRGDVMGLKRCISKKVSDLTIYHKNC